MKKTYKILIDKRVTKKDLQPLSAKDRLRILQRINNLAQDPYPKGYKKLDNYTPVTYRIRQGDYRVLYRVEDKVLKVLVVRVGHRREIYR